MVEIDVKIREQEERERGLENGNRVLEQENQRLEQENQRLEQENQHSKDTLAETEAILGTEHHQRAFAEQQRESITPAPGSGLMDYSVFIPRPYNSMGAES